MTEDKFKHYLGNFAQKAIIEQNGRVLVCRGIGDSIWELPGGRLHKDESPQDGLVREVKEELNLEISVGAPIHICRSFHYSSKVWQIFAGYECTLAGDTEIKVDKQELDECKWVSLEEFKTIEMYEDCREIADVWLASQKPS